MSCKNIRGIFFILRKHFYEDFFLEMYAFYCKKKSFHLLTHCHLGGLRKQKEHFIQIKVFKGIFSLFSQLDVNWFGDCIFCQVDFIWIKFFPVWFQFYWIMSGWFTMLPFLDLSQFNYFDFKFIVFSNSWFTGLNGLAPIWHVALFILYPVNVWHLALYI